MRLEMFKHGRTRDSLLLPLDDTHLDLMLQFRIRLVRCEPTTRFNVSGTFCTGNGILHDEFGNFNLQSWTDLEWNSYSQNFVRTITNRWDNRFTLTPDRAWYVPRTGQPATQAVIQTDLSIQLVDSASDSPHVTYHIIKPSTGGFRSFAGSRDGLFTHRDLELEWQNPRIGRDGRNVSYLQTTVLHEFGHTLGLDHVNGVGNADRNYGVTVEQREDIMGCGGHLTARHARPWIDRMNLHLHPAHHEHLPRFTGRVNGMQLIEYWDNDWIPPTPNPVPLL